MITIHNFDATISKHYRESQMTFADFCVIRLDTHPDTVNAWLSGTRDVSPAEIASIADKLGESPEDLRGFSSDAAVVAEHIEHVSGDTFYLHSEGAIVTS